MQVTQHVHALEVPFQIPVAPGVSLERSVWVFLVLGRRICLIDSGVAGAQDAIFDYIRQLGREPAEISLLVLTHSHPDHIGAALAIQQATGCAIAAHPAEKAWIEDTDMQSRQRPVSGFASLVGGSVRVDRQLADGEVIELDGELSLEVLHTPGHSAGSISLLLRGDQALFCGDAIPVPGDMPIWDDFAASVRSVQRLQGIAGLRALLSSWNVPREGEAIRHAMEQGLAYLERMREVVGRVASRDGPLEPMDLCRRVVAELGLPSFAANPLVARSFAAVLKAIGEAERPGS
jgi:hydroxyacylglutathione hydrolase